MTSSPSPGRRRARSSRLATPDSGNGLPTVVEAEFGPSGLIFSQTTERLSSIFNQAVSTPPVGARYREWQSRQVITSAQDSPGESSFIRQTYLALLARLVARQFVAPRRLIGNDEELLEVVNVDYFSRRGIGNFGEGDIFSWLPLDPRWELGLDALSLETVRGLADELAKHDFSDAQPGILDFLFQHAAPGLTITPSWLAEQVVEQELGMKEDPTPSLLDPACGTGTFLSAAIGAIRQGVTERNGDEFDLIFDTPEKVRGMDVDPMAVALARLNYLLALGDLVQDEHPPFLMPVYLADASARFDHVQSEDSILKLPTSAGDFPLPAPFITNPLLPDWVLGRITNYMDGAQLRLHVQPEEVAVQEVLNAYYNYLTAPKPRTPVPDALTPQQADTLLETARMLVHLHIRGEGTLWLHLVQNMAAPAILGHRGFERLVSRSPASLLDAYAETYLRPDGRGVGVIAASVDDAEANSQGKRVVPMKSRSPDTALLLVDAGPRKEPI